MLHSFLPRHGLPRTHTHLNFTRLSWAGERGERMQQQLSEVLQLVLVCHVRMCATLLQFCPGIVSMRSSVAVSCHVHGGVSYSPPPPSLSLFLHYYLALSVE